MKSDEKFSTLQRVASRRENPETNTATVIIQQESVTPADTISAFFFKI